MFEMFKSFKLIARKGSAALTATLVAAALTSVIGLATVKLSAANMSATTATKIATQAEQYAKARAGLIRATKYNDLEATTVEDITDSNLKLEVIKGDETNYSSDIKQRIMTVNLYNGSDTSPIYSLSVPRFSKEANGAGVPIGTVIAWAGLTAPADGNIWLECNGQSCGGYSELISILGKSTVPDYRGRFLQGVKNDEITGTIKESKIPSHIHATGKQTYNNNGSFIYAATNSQPFYLGWGSGLQHWNGSGGDNGRTNLTTGTNISLYGWGNLTLITSRPFIDPTDDTPMQPPTVTVKYFIRAQ